MLPSVGSFACLKPRGNRPDAHCYEVSTDTTVSPDRVEALGIGKVTDAGPQWSQITFFVAPPRPEVLTYRVPTALIQACDAPPESRAYWFDPVANRWLRGRILGPPVDGGAIDRVGLYYSLRLPNDRELFVPASDLEVRCRVPVPDPTEMLAAQVSETPFFASDRATLLTHLAEQREALGGLTALGASAVEHLHPHQVSVVRRVLSDPVQRYILADEVGLGKTIEAALLARQHLLDEGPEASVLVLCPEHLCNQWGEELAQKLGLRPDERVRICSAEGDWGQERPSMLILDEAHQAAAWAYGGPADQERFQRLVCLAGAAKGVLLLSATPVLHNEDGFFAMLHLLDSSSYPFARLPAFRARVAARGDIAKWLARLVKGTPLGLARGAIGQLATLLAGDVNGLARLQAAQQAVATARVVGDEPDVRELRDYVAESYKLHRRILRTRRDDGPVRALLPSRTGLTWLACGADRARRGCEDFLEEWRGGLPPGAGVGTADAARVFSSFLTAHLSHPRRLLDEVRARHASLGAGRAKPLFVDEQVMLSEWAAQLEDEVGLGDSRIDRLVGWLTTEHVGPNQRAIVFVDTPEVAVAIERSLRAAGVATVARCSHGDASAQGAFRDGKVRVLLCDRSVEEGLNLQSVAAKIVFFDLPFEPMRIEQRIGRLDRLEGFKRLRMVGFAAGGGYERRWAALLEEATKVFHRSIAPLQYVLAAERERIIEALPALGAEAIDKAAERMQHPDTGLEAEFGRIQAQELIDQLDWGLEEVERFRERVGETEERAQEAGFRPYDAWLLRCLHYERCPRADVGRAHLVHRLRNPTLAPLQDTLFYFSGFVDHQATRELRDLCVGPLAFDRETAAKDGAALLRIGHPFIDRLLAFVRNDERGTAWAMWRETRGLLLTGPELYFCFDFVIEADASHGLLVLARCGGSQAALRRRLDAAFGPQQRRLWVDREGHMVQDRARLEVLEQPYEAAVKGGSDTNLRLERWAAVEEQLGLASWADTCRAARAAAEQALRSDAAFVRRGAEAQHSHRRMSLRTRAVLESRLARLEHPAEGGEQTLLSFETQLADAIDAGISQPTVRVDAVGAIVLGSGPLPRGAADEPRQR